MTSRPLRDIVGESLWNLPGIIRHPWAYWSEAAPHEVEEYRRRADRLITLLSRLGIDLAVNGQPVERPIPASPVIWEAPLIGEDSIRRVRATSDPDRYEIAREPHGGADQVQVAFSLRETLGDAGQVLRGDRDMLKVPGLMSRLAAGAEILRIRGGA